MQVAAQCPAPCGVSRACHIILSRDRAVMYQSRAVQSCQRYSVLSVQSVCAPTPPSARLSVSGPLLYPPPPPLYQLTPSPSLPPTFKFHLFPACWLFSSLYRKEARFVSEIYANYCEIYVNFDECCFSKVRILLFTGDKAMMSIGCSAPLRETLPLRPPYVARNSFPKFFNRSGLSDLSRVQKGEGEGGHKPRRNVSRHLVCCLRTPDPTLCDWRSEFDLVASFGPGV